jgi:hypothetical protein
VAINARNEETARTAAFLIEAAYGVIEGNSSFSTLAGQTELCELKKCPLKEADDRPIGRQILSTQNIPAGCLLAVKTALSRPLTYALAKIWMSYQMFSIDGLDLDPANFPVLPKSPHPFDHIAYAQAIVLAYAAIEELALEIRASAQNPSRKNGKWNPEVRNDLIKRLQKAGIDLDEKFPWNLRGPTTKLEQGHPPQVISPAPWAKWRVRDGFVEVIDAIAHASWLRSKVSAHRSRYEFMRVLSVYEVANCQYLARRLFLERCGFWRSEQLGFPSRKSVLRSESRNELSQADGSGAKPS